ncbi:YkvA family protein [Streptomyces sp. NBC_01142]|uniref:YkvA family protein n=1 Tax=Streptomyces sp. NBC_01142 TaxID=2975865 RepID=UPI002253CA45|nr:YkvA family protein [Streptomyces sp. NBC_01142]MCX4825573.1 YkvA family protein [Streptomyces sp. NBC_01142]
MSTELTVALIVAAIAVLAMLAVTLVLVVKVARARAVLREAGVPLKNKAVFWGALVYAICPVDLIPDPVYLDDIGVLLLALRALHSAANAGPGPLTSAARGQRSHEKLLSGAGSDERN